MVEAAAPGLSPAERRWSLAAAITAIAVFGLGIGLTAPLLSLMLEERGVDASLNGLNAAVTFVGVIIGAGLVPLWVRRFGLKRFMLACMLIDAAFFPLLKIFDNVYAWFPLRLGLGFIGASLFTASEAWIGSVAGDTSRGRVLGLYAAVLSAGFGAGALLLPLTGTAGWTPFVANAAISLLAMLPLLRIGDLAPRFETAAGFGLIGFVRRAPLIAFSVALFGFYEGIAMTLMPVWGVRVGLVPAMAAATISAIYFGSIAWQVPIGWLSDHISRFAVLRLCAVVAVIGAVLLPLMGAAPWPLMATLFVWGGITTALYPVVLSMLGDRFSGAELVAGNAAVIMIYGIGSLAGPALAGAAMDVWNPHGLTVLIALAFTALLVAAGRAKA